MKVHSLLKAFVLSSLMVVGLQVSSVMAATLYVGGTGPYTTIQAAINAAAAGDTVQVAPGTYYENINISAAHLGITLVGSVSNPSLTVIDGAQSGSVITILGTDTVVENMIIKGFVIQNGKNYISSSIFDNVGGGIKCQYAGLQLEDVIIQNNRAQFYGGGIWFEGDGGVLVEGCSLLRVDVFNSKTEHSDWGGGAGIFARNVGTFFMQRCRIVANNPFGHTFNSHGGGGIGIRTANNVKIENSLIALNEIRMGCGAQAAAAGLTLAIHGAVDIINTTIANNKRYTISGSGAGMEVGFPLSSATKVRLINSILWGNVAEIAPNFGVFAPSQFRFHTNESAGNPPMVPPSLTAFAHCDIQGGQAAIDPPILDAGGNPAAFMLSWLAGNIDQDPLFVDVNNWQANGFSLQSTVSAVSPCAGAGASQFTFAGPLVVNAPLVDLIGAVRPAPVGTQPDMGAYEVSMPLMMISGNLIGMPTGNAQPYTIAANGNVGIGTMQVASNVLTTTTTSTYSLQVPTGWAGVLMATPLNSLVPVTGGTFQPNVPVTSNKTQDFKVKHEVAGKVCVNLTCTQTIPNVEIRDNGSAIAVTNSSGEYSFKRVHNWSSSGSVMPALTGCSPTVVQYPDLVQDVPQDYLCRGGVVVSGRVLYKPLAQWVPMPGAAVQYAGSVGGVTMSGVAAMNSTTGLYQFSVDPGWTGTVTASKPGWVMAPAVRTYAPLYNDQVNQDFKASMDVIVKAQPYTTRQISLAGFQAGYANPAGNKGAYDLVMKPLGADIRRLTAEGLVKSLNELLQRPDLFKVLNAKQYINGMAPGMQKFFEAMAAGKRLEPNDVMRFNDALLKAVFPKVIVAADEVKAVEALVPATVPAVKK